ncbi:MAG: ABC transporter substrate-binding protein [Brachymonas sp.]|nr:ABC transporter substrate-binding protein [Brachymonas sp.]
MPAPQPQRRQFLLGTAAAMLGATALGWGCRQAPGNAPAASAPAAGSASSAGTVSDPRTVTDFRGKTITLQAPAQRVVCLLESALSGIYMLGAQDRLMGVPANVYTGDVAPHYASLDPRLAAKSIETPGNWDFTSLEKVIALKPDVVIQWSQQREGIAALEARGIPVYGVFIASMADLEKEINDLAILTGAEARAQALLAYTQSVVQDIGQRTSAIPQTQWPRVYYAWGQGMLETACRGSMVDDMIRLAGGINTCTEQIEHGKPSLESVLQWNPEVIVLWPSERRTVESVLADAQWRNVAAIRNRRVYPLPEVFFSDLWTLKYQFALQLMAHWFHPTVFGQMPDAKLRAGIMGKLYGSQPL